MARRSSQKSGSGRGRRRDPNAPKQNKRAWQLFFSDNREEVTKQNPNSSYLEISKKLGEMWRQSDENTKRQYQKQYETGQAEYNQKLTEYKDQQKKKQQSSNSGQTKKENNNNNVTNEYNDQL